MAEYTEAHFDFLLGCLLRFEGLAQTAFKTLQPSHFAKIGGNTWHGLIFKIAVDNWETHKTLPDLAFVRLMLPKYVPNNDGWKATLLEIENFYARVDETRVAGPCREIIADAAETCVFTPTLKTIVKEAETTSNLPRLRQQIEKLEAQRLSAKGGRSVSGMSLLTAPINSGRRVPSHIPWLDAKFSGEGPVRGSSMAIIAPQGHGKTSLGIQLATAQARNGEHALLVLFEEGLTLSVRAKITASILGIEYTPLAAGLQNLDPEDVEGRLECLYSAAANDKERRSREYVKEHLTYMDEYLHILDLCNDGDMDTVQAELEALKAAGTSPVYMYVDWAGWLADRLIGAGDKRSKEAVLKEVAYRVTDVAQRYDLIGCISQQMSPEAVGYGAFRINSLYCAADCKGFTQSMKYVFIINPRDDARGEKLSTNLSLLLMPKTRDDAQVPPQLVRLRGEIPRFENMDDQYIMRSKSFTRADPPRDNNNRLPEE